MYRELRRATTLAAKIKLGRFNSGKSPDGVRNGKTLLTQIADATRYRPKTTVSISGAPRNCHFEQ